MTIEKSIATYTNQRSASQEALLDFCTVTSMKERNYNLIVDMLESHIAFLNNRIDALQSAKADLLWRM